MEIRSNLVCRIYRYGEHERNGIPEQILWSTVTLNINYPELRREWFWCLPDTLRPDGDYDPVPQVHDTLRDLWRLTLDFDFERDPTNGVPGVPTVEAILFE